MERERRKKQQTIRLIITEIIMVAAIIVTVIFLTLLAMGYSLNKEGEVGQQGLAQINSWPTGAVINIDGNDIFPHTNAARLLSEGQHTIKLTKDNYDSWEKTIDIQPGILLKLDYPRLFWQGRSPEKMREPKGELTLFEPAPNHDSILYAESSSTIWTLLDIRGDTAVDTTLDLTELLKNLTLKRVFWNGDNNKVLVAAENTDNQTEWLLLNIKNLQNSINLTHEFGLQFSDIIFITNSGERLIALEDNGNLRMISTAGKTISQVLATNVQDYVVRDTDIMYLTADNQVKLFKEGEEDILITKFPEAQTVKLSLFEYLSKKYLGLVADNKLSVYRGEYPNTERTLNDMELVFEGELTFTPEKIRIEADNELIVMKAGRKVAVFDAELSKLHQFELAGDQLFFIDFYLIGTSADDKLIICDFDGTNRREITNATGTALITKNGKWLYYLNDNDIYREQIVE